MYGTIIYNANERTGNGRSPFDDDFEYDEDDDFEVDLDPDSLELSEQLKDFDKMMD